ncbi:outer membrane lipoprotein carrier protein [Luteibacter sp. UNCMF331Sha3.1]|uniref:outer membrane lipoprotein chaperone LolA n=1 Tax=Luteibacter sp. UNCMF331Sha3.1 TaxID=1502760 RepID=UPI0008D7B7EB|nr:outer membrane lipoprotein chaperone LolA [Luteibacter sp. UNCMF331Sha3.1]SEN09324.1 outer membrane lipoprotein carrier protein [Luteibacter sp. UNCMF331Sha3.1]
MKRLLLAATLSLLSLPTFAAGPARDRLDTFAKGMHSLSGRFSQTLSGPNGEQGKTSSGTLALQAPRQFRWETTAPYKQTIVADGSRVWLYDPDLEQVTVRKQSSEEAQSPLTVLTDVSRIDKDFKVTEQGEHDGFQWLRLTSTSKDPQFAYADLGFDAEGLKRMAFRDQLGNVTRIQFAGLVRNAALPDGTFNFVPPQGTDVVGDAPVLQTQPVK